MVYKSDGLQNPGHAEPRSDLKREVELGSHSELDRLLIQVSTAGPRTYRSMSWSFELCDSVPRSC